MTALRNGVTLHVGLFSDFFNYVILNYFFILYWEIKLKSIELVSLMSFLVHHKSHTTV